MINYIDSSHCSGCGACLAACPINCITMAEDREGFYYPNIKKDQCIDCGMCEKVCPFKINVNGNQNSFEKKCYAAFANDLTLRLDSSSGGIFSLIAENVLNNGGIVYGASFNKHFSVEHIGIENIQDLHKIRGSKYIQSKAYVVFEEIKQKLDNKMIVLFCGTPCQVEGLLLFLKKDYSNLITIDLICHGVPSPKSFRSYIKSLEEKYKSTILDINFRNKEKGWTHYSFNAEFTDSESYSETLNNNHYMNMFLKNINLRASCYNCKVRGEGRQSDITLGDFWGVEKVCPEMFDDRGTSLVIINSKKGEKMFTQVEELSTCQKVNMGQALENNMAYYDSPKKPKNRNSYFNNIDRFSFEKAYAKYVKESSIRKIYFKSKNLIKKFLVR